jgi:hypothetical protein
MLPAPTILRRLVGDLSQIARVRRVILADGPEAGVEALAFSTGGGLDFLVTAGRMLDIATLSWRGAQLGWQSPAGLRPTAIFPAGDDRRFDAGFGGFLNTCGFEHIRQPSHGRPLHGSAPFTPARLTAHGEDWNAAEPLLYCEGEVVIWCHGAGGHRLRRRIEAPIGGATLRLRDTVEVIGAEPMPVIALYHFNLGYPVVREGTEISFDERHVAGIQAMPETDQPLPAVLHAASTPWARCRVIGGETIEFCWRTDTLPWLQFWKDLRPAVGVMSIEPCSIGRLADGSNAPAPLLGPGEQYSFAIDILLRADRA